MNDCLLAESIARFNDYLIRAPRHEVSKTPLAKWADNYLGKGNRKNCQRVLAYSMGVIVFPIFVGFDLFYQTIKVPLKKIQAVAIKDQETKKQYLAEAEKCQELAEKCFLGLIASPCSLICPDLVTRHFVPRRVKEGIIEAGGKYHFAKGKEEHPKTVEDVQELVKKAIREEKKISISGSHMSQSKDTLPSKDGSICVSMKGLKAIEIDSNKKVAKVQAGATWRDLQEAANHHGLAVKVMQASNVFSIGGSLSVNCHGWDHRTGSLVETIQSITIINGQGELQTLTLEDELFGLVIGGHGLFGIIVEAEIELAENEKLTSIGISIKPEDYVSYFNTKVLPDENQVMHLYRLSLAPNRLLKEGIAVSYHRSSGQVCSAPTPILLDEPEKGNRPDRIMVHVARSFAWARGLYWSRESQKIQSKEVLTRNEIMRPPIYAAFNNSRADAEWLQEYFVKGKDLAHFLDKLGKVLTDNQVALLNASVRYVKHDRKTQLPYARDEDRFAIVLFFTQSLAPVDVEKTKKWVQEIVDYLNKYEGTYYLPYQHFPTVDQFKLSYPSYQQVINKKREYDKLGLFENGLYMDYFEYKA